MRRTVPLVLVTTVSVAFAIFALTFHSNRPPPTNAVHVSIIPGARSYVAAYDPDNVTVVIGVNNTVIWNVVIERGGP